MDSSDPSGVPGMRRTASTSSFTSVAAAAHDWEEDKPECSICTARFGLLNRRHHCRMCGKCVCDACSPNKVQVVAGRSSKRVCLPCVGATTAGPPVASQGSAPMSRQATAQDPDIPIVDPGVAKGLRTELVHVQEFLDKFAHQLEGLLDLTVSADSTRIPPLEKLRPESFPSLEIDEAIRRCEVCIQPLTHALKLLADNGEKAPTSFHGEASVANDTTTDFATHLTEKLTIAQEDLRLVQVAQETCTNTHSVEDETDGPAIDTHEETGGAAPQTELVEIGQRLQRFTIDVAPLVEKAVPVYDTDDPVQTCGMVMNVLDDFAPALQLCAEKEQIARNTLDDMSTRLEKIVGKVAPLVDTPLPSFEHNDSIDCCRTAIVALEDIAPALQRVVGECPSGPTQHQSIDGYSAADNLAMKEKMADRASKVSTVDDDSADGFAN